MSSIQVQESKGQEPWDWGQWLVQRRCLLAEKAKALFTQLVDEKQPVYPLNPQLQGASTATDPTYLRCLHGCILSFPLCVF